MDTTRALSFVRVWRSQTAFWPSTRSPIAVLMIPLSGVLTLAWMGFLLWLIVYVVWLLV